MIDMPNKTSTTAIGSDNDYDVIVLGGGFSGSATALLLKRWLPDLRVLIIERRDEQPRKVGESTVEISGLFLSRVLGLHDYLYREHLPKNGLRYWFANSGSAKLAEMSEIGGARNSLVPSYQLDRAKLDQHLQTLASEAGVEIARPATVREIDLGWPQSSVVYKTSEGKTQATARWVVDASGRQTVLSRKLGLRQVNEQHPVNSAWARWTGVKDLDGVAMRGNDPREPMLPNINCSRRLATNHFMGYGWWCWVIPLSGGETSVGLTWDPRLLDVPGEGGVADKYTAFVKQAPGLQELLADAEMVDDFQSYAHLPYYSTQYAGKGWALVGDAAAFIDPYYSMGLDHASFSIWRTAEMLEQDFKSLQSEGMAKDMVDNAASHMTEDHMKEDKHQNKATNKPMMPAFDLEQTLKQHNEDFLRSYHRWFAAIYRGKYHLFGDAELTVAAFLMDTGTYYLGVVWPAYKNLKGLASPSFGHDNPGTRIAAKFLAWFQRRLVKLAERRRELGIYGQKNEGWRLYVRGFELGGRLREIIFAALRIWLRCERQTKWASIKQFFGKASVAESLDEQATAATSPFNPNRKVDLKPTE